MFNVGSFKYNLPSKALLQSYDSNIVILIEQHDQHSSRQLRGSNTNTNVPTLSRVPTPACQFVFLTPKNPGAVGFKVNF